MLLKSIGHGDLIKAKRTALAIRENVSGFEDYLSTTIEPEYYIEQRTTNSTTATKVFAIPELFEIIAEDLDVEDLMNCYSVSRTFRDSLENSSKL